MEETIRWLNILKDITIIQTLLSKFELTPENKVNLWRNILTLLNSEQSPIIIDDKNGSESEDPIEVLLTYITQNCDIIDEIEDEELLYSKIYEAIQDLINEQSENTFWNASVQELIQYFINQIDSGETTNDKIILPIGEDWETNDKSIKISTLKYLLDAGFNFPKDSRGTNTWVSPWYNIDGRTYDKVRKCDEINNILIDDNKLQYTKDDTGNFTIYTNWLRLLMPQYGRRTEVEDLNRNFWVIAQTIAAISNYLFNEDNPILKTLNGMLREITEIWENILYLWTNFVAITQNNLINNTQIIHIPLPPRSNEEGRKYDKFDKSDIDENENIFCSANIDNEGNISIQTVEDFHNKIINRLSLLTEIYSGKNLCVLPYIRLNNYKHNYYEIEYYPAIYFYSASKKQWKYKILTSGIEGRLDMAFSIKYNSPSMSGVKFSSKICGTNQNYKSKIAYVHSYDDEIITSETLYLYGAVRIVPEIELGLDNEGFPCLKSFKFSIIDAGYNLINGNIMDKLIFTCVAENIEQESDYLELVLQDVIYNNEESDNIVQFKNYNSNFSGYYLGEVISSRKKIEFNS